MHYWNNFRAVMRPLLQRNMLICIFTGFSSGLPLWLILNLLPAWLAEYGVSLKTIGAMSLVMLPYTWKFIWSPLADRYSPPLGRRRGWMAITQVLLLLCIGLYGLLDPHTQMPLVVMLSLAVSWLSATQDVATDAYRRELLADNELGLGNAIFVNAYKLASLVPGSLALILADRIAWHWVFLITALFMLSGLITTLLVREPEQALAPTTLRAATVEPIREFLSRYSVKSALAILLFTLFYKLGDSMATALATPFYLQMGYSKTEIGEVAKMAGLLASVAGGLVGGLWMMRLGIVRSLWIFGVAQALPILGFAWLAQADKDIASLAVVIALEAFGTGMGTTAFVAFIASMTDRRFSATQYALLSSLAAVPRSFLNASTGWLVEAFGWVDFFLLCTLLTVPGMLLLLIVAPWPARKK
jgi:PAT family beta-lactamase induction signal transducer AmpG